MNAVLESGKYRVIYQPLIRRIAEEELTRRRNLKEAVKATKNKLHQIGGAYLNESMPYREWFDELKRTPADNLRNRCRDIMRYHASTRERLPILNEFYETLFKEIGPVKSILDVACGLNPLAIPWMPLEAGGHYYALDIYEDMMEFVGRFLVLLRIKGQAQARDVLRMQDFPQVDVAFVLKTLPCLTQVDKMAAARLLRSLKARQIVVSYPVRSLGGKQKGMVETYENQLRALVVDMNYTIKRFEFQTELAFVLKT